MNRRSIIFTLASAAAIMAAGCSSNASETGVVQTMNDGNTMVLINPFEVPADKLGETIAMWEQAREFLQVQPGYISTALHQSMAPDAKFRLINIAKWESMETFQAATAKMQAEAGLPVIEGVVPNPALYTIVRRD